MNTSFLGKLSRQIMTQINPGVKNAQKAKKYIKTGWVNLQGTSPYETAIQSGRAEYKHNQLIDFKRIPAADEFRRSAQKQNAQIISDVVGFPKDSGLPQRIITKKLPSGTFVTKMYNDNGKLVGKEVIKKNATAVTSYRSNGEIYSYHVTNGDKNIAKVNYGKVLEWQPPFSVTDGYKSSLNTCFRDIRGVTEEVNKGNVFYDSQKAIWQAEQNMQNAQKKW